MTTLASSTTLNTSFNIINVNCDINNIILTLPIVSSHIGISYTIAKIDTGVGSVVIIPYSGDKLNNIVDDTITLTVQGDHTKLVCHSLGWLL